MGTDAGEEPPDLTAGHGVVVRALNESAYGLSQAAQGQLGDLVWAAFQTGDELQRDALDLMFDVATLRAFAPSYVARFARSLAEQSQETGSVLWPGPTSLLAWQELRNKYEVYNLVKHVRELLQVPSGTDFPLGELVARAYGQGAYRDLWAIEGLGHDYAVAFWRPPERVQGLMTNARARELPECSFTMMHAGMGLAFAEQLLRSITPYSAPSGVRRVVEEFLRLCRENSSEGYEGAAYESLGLVARTWHAQTVGAVDRALQDVAPDVAGCFWHGAGRALYFLPIHFIPGSPSPILAAEREAPHDLARLNMLAGLAWAMTVVNVRQPEIMAHRLVSRRSDWAPGSAFANGMVSSLIMADDITPNDVHVTDFCRYRPDPSDAERAQLWRDLVAQPCAEALDRFHPVLKEHRRLGEVFRFQPLADLVTQLERQTKER